MSSSKVTSCEYLIARTINNFNIDSSDYKKRAIEWVAEGIGLMDIKINLQDNIETVIVTDNISKLPCDIELITLLECEGIPLLPLDNADAKNNKSVTNNYRYHGYSLNSGGYIYTPTIESGGINVYYKRIPLNDRGYPMIPDVPEVLEAMSMFLILRMLGRGEIHPVFNNYNDLSLSILGYDMKGRKATQSLFAKARNAIGTPNNAERYMLSLAIRGGGSSTDVYNESTYRGTSRI